MSTRYYFKGLKGLVIALLLALLIGGLSADFGALAGGQLNEVKNIIFTPHKGKDAGPPESPLGFIEIVTEDAIYKSRIAGGAMDIIFEDGKVTIPQKSFYIKGEPLTVAGISTGNLVVMLTKDAVGKFDPSAGIHAIQVPMELKLMLIGMPEVTFPPIPTKFKGQRELDPYTGRQAIAGDIEMTEYMELPVFGATSLIDIRVWGVEVKVEEEPKPGSVANKIEQFIPKPRVDVFFLVDLSASMSEEIPAFKENIHEIVEKLEATGLDIAFGLGAFSTFPGFAGFWPDEQNFPYKKLLDPGPGGNVVAAITNPAFDYILAGDQPESQLFALNQVASGPNAVKWREGSLRLIVLLTDQPFTVPDMTRGQNVGLPTFPGPKDLPPFPNTVKALTDRQIEVIGIAGDPDQRERELLISDLKAIAGGTGSVAPAGGIDCDGIPATVEVRQGEPIVCELDRLATNIMPAITNSVKAKIELKGVAVIPLPAKLEFFDNPETPFDERDIIKEVHGPSIEQVDGMFRITFIVVKQWIKPLLAEATAEYLKEKRGADWVNIVFDPITLPYRKLDEEGKVLHEDKLTVTLEELNCMKTVSEILDKIFEEIERRRVDP